MRTPLFMLSVAATLMAGGAVAKPAPKPVMIGYVATFKDMKGTLAKTDLSKLTHINIAFLNPGPDNSLVTGDVMTCMTDLMKNPVATQDLRDAIAIAHAGGVKVLASMGGGTIPLCSGDWVALLTPQNRPVLIANLLAFVDEYKLDGLDIDLEWDVLTKIDMAGEYVPFAKELGAALKKRGKLLTCATASHPGGMVPKGSLASFDYVNIMSYDTIGPSWGQAGAEHASLAQAQADVATWQAQGLPKSKLVLGVPFYGYGFNGYNPGYAYKDILATFGEAATDTDIQGKACAGCQYITYNGRPTIRAKAQLAAQTGAGVMIWELSEDALGPDSLLGVAYDSLHEAADAK